MPTSESIPTTSRRLWARWFDQLIKFFLQIPFWLQVLGLLWSDEGTVMVHWSWVLYFLVIQFSYEPISYYLCGTTLGKYWLDLRVVDRQDPNRGLGLAQSYLRGLLTELSCFFGWSLFATLFFRYDRSHWIDLWAGTRVVSLTSSSSSHSESQQQSKQLEGPRARPGPRPKIRWILGSLLFLIFLFSGIEQAMIMASGFNWGTSSLEFNSRFLGVDFENVSDSEEI